MNKYSKLIEFTEEELFNQLESGIIDTDFLVEYIVKRDKVYNMLIDEIEKLESEHNV